jgi:hypothetical protein
MRVTTSEPSCTRSCNRLGLRPLATCDEPTAMATGTYCLLSATVSLSRRRTSPAAAYCGCLGTTRFSTSIPIRRLSRTRSGASASIPLFFKPVTVTDGKSGDRFTLVDGGVLSNFPIEIFDRTDGLRSRWPTFGVRILPDLPVGTSQLLPKIARPALRLSQFFPPFRLLEQVVTTAIVGNDQTHLERPGVFRSTIQIDTHEIGIVEFDASSEKREKIVARGHSAAEQFLEKWDWEAYKKEFRHAPQRRPSAPRSRSVARDG